MAANTFEQRLKESAQFWKENHWLYGVGGFLLGLLCFPFLNLLINNFRDLLDDLVPEAVGIVVTVFLIDRIYERHEEKRRSEEKQQEEQRKIEEEKRRLIREFGSSVNATAINAARELGERGWLGDGTLARIVLNDADLSNAPLSKGIFRGAELMVNLKNAQMEGVDLSFAKLIGSVLDEANLSYANLSSAILAVTKFRKTYLGRADLSRSLGEGADFSEANLMYANLAYVHLASATFNKASLWLANMSNGNFRQSRFIQANLHNADLHEATLINCNLSGADLSYSNIAKALLDGANMSNANLENSNLSGITWHYFEQPPILDETTILPNGDNYDPTKGIEQLERFTNPNHPKFWEPEWVKQKQGIVE